MAESDQEHLLNHLRDTHAIEVQALRQLERAARASGDDGAEIYREHFEQSQEHEQKIRELVEARGHEPSPIEDKTLRGGAIGLRQLADVSLDTPVKTAMNLYALEHLEIAAYGILAQMARGLDDGEVVEEAERIQGEEEAAAEKLAETFDRAVELLLEKSGEEERAREQGQAEEEGSADKADHSADEEDSADKQNEHEGSADDAESQLLLSHLRDTHALEEQSLALLRIGLNELDKDDELERIYREHLEQTEGHEQRVNERIESQDAKPSAVRDLHMGAATAGLRDVTDGPPDAQAKLAMNVFCVEHLEIAGYELLARLAKQCGDGDTAKAAEEILEEERAMAQALRDQFEHIAQLTLESDASYATARSAETPEGDRADSAETPEGDRADSAASERADSETTAS